MVKASEKTHNKKSKASLREIAKHAKDKDAKATVSEAPSKAKAKKAAKETVSPTPSETVSPLEFEQHVDSDGKEVDNPYLLAVLDLVRTIPEWDEFFSRDEEDAQTRGNNWIRLEVLGQPLIDKYSWAIPNARALRIIQHFSPVIEIGAGRGYWASLLRRMGVEVEAFDRHVYNVASPTAHEQHTNKKKKQTRETPKLWTVVKQGDARMLVKKCFQKHTLMLCYPDEDSELSMDCLERYNGEYLIHIGELVTTGTHSGGTQAPFGRTTCSQFQINLLEYFHCILVAELPCFPFSKDCITVWKRTVFVPGRSAYGPQHKSRARPEEVAEEADGEAHDEHAEEDRDEDDEDEEEEHEYIEHADGDEEENEEDGDEEEDDSEDDCWADVPRIERLPMDRAATELAFLLQDNEKDNSKDSSIKSKLFK